MRFSLGGILAFTLCIGTCRESSLSGINWYAIYHAEAVIEISEYDISPYAKTGVFAKWDLEKKDFISLSKSMMDLDFQKRFRKKKFAGYLCYVAKRIR